MKRIAVITSRQNYVWQSMQEVFPALEQCWEEASESSKIINADEDRLRDNIFFLMSCDVLVIIAFNETIARFILNIRKTLNLQIPIVFHLHGLATIACWPGQYLGILDCMNSGDAFIGTCIGDLNCMQHTFLNANTYNIPYPYFPLTKYEKRITGERVFAYIGRISDQKNIHLLLESYKEFLNITDEIIPLYIYGKEDHLGSPNMGLDSTECLSQLLMKVEALAINKFVHFKGFQSRKDIYRSLGSSHIFVSASTHSDENFGMAAMRSLASGGKAVLSNWGGHKEFKRFHPESVWVSDVYIENFKPVINPQHFAKCMYEAFKSQQTFSQNHINDYFLPKSVIKSFQDILTKLNFSPNKLQISDIALEAYQQQRFFESQGDVQKVFKGYSDPLAQVYLTSYC